MHSFSVTNSASVLVVYNMSPLQIFFVFPVFGILELSIVARSTDTAAENRTGDFASSSFHECHRCPLLECPKPKVSVSAGGLWEERNKRGEEED